MRLIGQELAEIVETIRKNEARRDRHENRRAARTDLFARMNFWPIVDGVVVRQSTALGRDISFTGIGLFLPFGLHAISKFIVELPLKNSSLRILSKVRHCRAMADSIYGVGAEFDRTVTEDEIVFDNSGAEMLRRIQDSILS